MTPKERISLVEQLRQPWTHYGKYNEPSYDRLRLIAADEIERMEAALTSGSPQIATTALSQAGAEAIQAGIDALEAAKEELRLIRMKDCGAVYNILLRSLTIPLALEKLKAALPIPAR